MSRTEFLHVSMRDGTKRYMEWLCLCVFHSRKLISVRGHAVDEFELILITLLILSHLNPPASCYEARDRGSCGGSMTRWYWNKNTKQCQSFTYGGCQGTKNNYQSLKECNHQCKYRSAFVDR